MYFERTRDYDEVRKILTHPVLYPEMGDDLTPPVEDFILNRHPDIWYVLVYDATLHAGEELLGLIPLFPENTVCWDLHLALLPQTWGGSSREIAREFMAWLWRETPCRRLVAHVPECNPKPLHFCPKYMGMQVYGRNRQSFLKGGRLVDRIDMGISRSE